MSQYPEGFPKLWEYGLSFKEMVANTNQSQYPEGFPKLWEPTPATSMLQDGQVAVPRRVSQVMGV